MTRPLVLTANVNDKDFLYDDIELTLIQLIIKNNAAEAEKYVISKQPMGHELRLPHETLDITLSPVMSQKNAGDRRTFIIINPEHIIRKLPQEYRALITIPYQGKDHIFSQNKNGMAAIHFAAGKGMLGVVKALIKKAIASNLPDYVNAKDGFGRTPLHYAAIAGDEEMIIFLIKSGADTKEQEINRGMYPYEFLNKNKTYRRRTLELLSGAVSSSIITPLADNPIYQAIINGNEEVAKKLAFTPHLFAQKDVLVAKAREKGNNNLANYLEFMGDTHELNKKYQISLLQNFSSSEEKDNFYLNLLKESIDLFLKYNKSPELRQYNINLNKNLIRLIGSSAHMVSFKFKKNTESIIPWQNIVSLRYFGEMTDNNPAYNLLFQRQIGNLQQAFSNLRPNLELTADGNFIGPAQNADGPKLIGYAGLNSTTDLVNDIRTLKKIAEFGKTLEAINPRLPNSEDRLALIAIMKQLGEFSKDSEQCNNMSRFAREQLNNVPWRMLGNLRDFVAKAPTRQKEYSVYEELLTSNSIETENFLLKIKTDITNISLKAKEVYNAMRQDISAHGWDAIILKYENQNEIEELTQQQKIELVADLKTEASSETRAAPKRRKEKLAENVEKFFSNDSSSEIKSYEELREKVKEVAFNEAVYAVQKLKWGNILDNRNGMFAALEECHDKFKASLATGAIDYQAKASSVLNKLMEIIIEDQNIINQLKQDRDLAKSEEVQKHLFARLEIYNNSPIKVLAVEQLYSELWLITNKMPANIRLNEDNTRLRNFIEHRNNIYDHVGRNLEQANFLEFIGIIFSLNEKINPQATQLNPANSPVQAVASQQTNPNTIALGWK